MKMDYSKDGENCDVKLFKEKFDINIDMDLSKIKDQSTGTYSYNFDFVGFILDDDDNLFTVFPKGFKVNDVIADTKMLFKLISKHRNKKPDRYIGEEYGAKFTSNYPFASFFNIYDYYRKYGVYFEKEQYVNLGHGSKLNWKETIRRTNYYIDDNVNVVIFPYYYDKTYNYNTFLSECMIFVIDYTISKFGAIIEISSTGLANSELDFLSNKESVIVELQNIRRVVFRDNVLNLIDNLICFFSEVNQGGKHYLKHYSFWLVWEDIVAEYLKNNFSEIRNNEMIFDKDSAKKFDFKKKKFYPNKANPKHFIDPDYYYVDGENQYIFDAKYKKDIIGIDYKQVSYFMFLKDKRDSINNQPLYVNTYSSLIIPAESNYSKNHFEMDESFSLTNSDIKIIETHIDIKEVIEAYIS